MLEVKLLGQSYENVLRLVLIVLLLFFIASAMRVKDNYVTGNFMGFGVGPVEKADINVGGTIAYRYGCYDSDGGDNVLERGFVTYRSGRQLINQFDSCQGSKTLIEWACLGGGKTSEVGTNEIVLNRECNLGCLNGVCIAEIYREGQDYSYDANRL